MAVAAFPRINNLHALNTLISSTPAAFTNISFIINCLLTYFNFVQWRSDGRLLRRASLTVSFSRNANQSNDHLNPGRNSWGETECEFVIGLHAAPLDEFHLVQALPWPLALVCSVTGRRVAEGRGGDRRGSRSCGYARSRGAEGVEGNGAGTHRRAESSDASCCREQALANGR